MIDLFRPFVPKEAREAVDEVLRSRFIGQGPKVDQFEKDFNHKFGLEGSVSVSSGTAALETAYDLLELGPGDEVISSPLTCAATNLLLKRRDCTIVWADVLKDTLCIDPADVRRKLTEKTRAVVQVHLGGVKADVGKLPVPVVSDAAQALGYFNGDYTCCSFQAIKHITTGDGGMIVCPTYQMMSKAKRLRWFGIDRDKKIANNWQAYQHRKMTFDIEEAGTKRHLTDIAAAMGIVGLQYYDQVIAHRRNLLAHYVYRLNGSGVEFVGDSHENLAWLCTVYVEKRDDFAKMLFEADVDTNVVQIRNDIYKIFGGVRADLPVLNAVEHKYISLPLGMHITIDDVDFICDCIRKGW